MICDKGAALHLDCDERDFIKSLAEDVCRFHEIAGGKLGSAPTHAIFEGVAQ